MTMRKEKSDYPARAAIFTNAQYTVLFVKASLIVTFLCVLFKQFELLALVPGRAFTPLYWYTFLTFALLHNGLLYWLFNSLLLIAIGVVIEHRLSLRCLAAIIFVGPATGVIAFSLASKPESLVLGAGFVVNAYMGAFLGYTFKYGSTYRLWAKLLNYFVILMVFSEFIYTIHHRGNVELVRYVNVTIIALSFILAIFTSGKATTK